MLARLAALTAVTALLPTSATAGSSSWKPAPSMLDGHAAHAVVVAGGAILAIGGTGRSGAPVRSVERFDGHRWRHESQLPVAGGLNATAAAAIGSKVYVIGGFAGTGNTPTALVHVYDSTTRTWSQAAALPSPRGGHAAVVLAGRIHVLGGGNSVSTLADHSVYDPKTDRWTAAAPLERSKGSPAAVVLGGRIYAIGGRSGFSDFGDVEIYDPPTDRWSRGPSVPPRGAAGAAVYGRSIYVFGGESQAAGRTLSDVLRLRPGARAWTKAEAMPTPRAFARAVAYRDAIYVVGGSRITASSTQRPGSESSSGSARRSRSR